MIGRFIAIIICIIFSAFFSGSEIAYNTLNESRLKQHGRDKDGKLTPVTSMACSIKESFDQVLIAILVGNNLVNMGSSSLATVIAVGLMGDSGAWVATAIMTVLIITFGEISPKILASEKPEGFAKLAAYPLKIWSTLLTPFVWVMQKLMQAISRLWKRGEDNGPAVTEDDLETIIETVEDEGVVDEDTADLLQSALDFGDTLAYEIITPRVDMVALDLEDSRDEMLKIAFNAPYTRLPVYQETTDNIVGILHMNLLYKALVKDPDADIASLLMTPVFVHKTMPLDDVFNIMRKQKSHMVVVTDEYGGTMGILTMEDVLEQLVGDIWDESDEIDEEFKEISDHVYEVDGDMRLVDFLDEFEKDEEDVDDDNATVGGWAVEMLGGYPKLMESFVFEDLKVTILKRQNLRVLKLKVEQDPNWVDEEEEEEDF